MTAAKPAKAAKTSTLSRAMHRKLTTSRAAITEAEAYLAKVVSEVEVSPRAEKRTITRALSIALDKLSKVRSDLEALEKLAADDR